MNTAPITCPSRVLICRLSWPEEAARAALGSASVRVLTKLLLILLLVLCSVPIFAEAAPGPAERIFVNGKIWTADGAQPLAEALAVRGDRLLAVGSTPQIRRLANAETAVVDLHGHLVVPGFQDSHLHFPGPSINSIHLDGLETLKDIQHAIAAFAAAHPRLPWITGIGWGYAAFPGKAVHKKYIDAVVADRPVYVSERDGHMGFGNSKALRLAGITRDTPDPPNGTIVHDAQGEPTGELKEAAEDLVLGIVPRRTEEDLYESFLQHMSEAAADGLTAAQNAWWQPEDQPVYTRALAAGQFKLRLRFAPVILPKEGAFPKNHVLARRLEESDLQSYKELRDAFRGPLMKFGAVKGMLDGTVDARTASMFDSYTGGGTGIPFWEAEDLNHTVALYDRAGFQVMLHAIGDRAINMALNAFEYAARTNGTAGRRHRVEHVEVPRLADLPRFRQLGVIASTQALFANPDATLLSNYAVLLGPERAAHANAFKLFDDAGAVQAFGSDWFVFDFSPLKGIYCAVTRLTPEGTPSGGWYPQNRISVEAALRHYTIDGAYASFDEQDRGSLAAGKLADFVELSRDILSIAPAEILQTRVVRTVMGGRDTYRENAAQ